MTALAIIAGALILADAWGEALANRYGQQVSPDGTLTQGFLLLTGWFVILVVAATVLLVVVL